VNLFRRRVGYFRGRHLVGAHDRWSAVEASAESTAATPLGVGRRTRHDLRPLVDAPVVRLAPTTAG
jgi:hypothetical protein